MSDNIIKTEVLEKNKVSLEGFVEKEPKLHHSAYNLDIYSMTLRVPRLTEGVFDYLPVDIPSNLIDMKTLKEGTPVRVEGNFRSFNEKKDGYRVHLILSVYAKEIEVLESTSGKNQITLQGHTCRPTNYRRTPLGREICDIMLAVPRIYKRSDYLPVIAWGRNATFADNLSVGTELQIEGRIQSRIYTKRLPDDTKEERVAYEVSASFISVVANSKEEEDAAPAEE